MATPSEIKALEAKAAAYVGNLTTLQLCDAFTATDDNRDEHIPTVRGWIMDELERRNPEAFEAWILSTEGNPLSFFTKQL